MKKSVKKLFDFQPSITAAPFLNKSKNDMSIF